MTYLKLCILSIMKSNILVTGSTAYDLLLSYDGHFVDALTEEAKESLSAVYLTSGLKRVYGGTGTNIAWGLKLLGADPVLVSTVGSDGQDYLDRLSGYGISTQHIDQVEDDVTSTAIIGSDTQEHQVGFFHAGADCKGVWPGLDAATISYAIISPRDERLMMEGIAWCKEHEVPYFFDPGQRMTSFGDDDLCRAIDGSEGVFVNEYEWSLLSDRLDISEEEHMLEHTNLLIVTRGEDAVSLFSKDGTEHVGSCPVSVVVNPTGAGDAFRAGFLTGLNAGWSQVQSAQLGAAMGAHVVEIAETQLEGVSREDVWKRAESVYGKVLPNL